MVPITGSSRLRQLLDVVMSLGAELDLRSTLRRIATAAGELTDARYSAFGVLDAAGTGLVDLVAVGLDDEARDALVDLPTGQGLLGRLIAEPEPLRIADVGALPERVPLPEAHPPLTSFMGVPVHVRSRVFGFLYLAGKDGAREFDQEDEHLAVALAKAAGMAIENASMHERFAEVVVVEERERLARELHDVVIQRLYGIGLNLQTCARACDDEAVTERLDAAVDDLDDTIRSIRSTIFELHSARPAGTSLRRAVLDLAAESARGLGFDPTVHFDGPVDSAIDATTREHLLIVAREALSNVARHASASEAKVHVSTDGTLLELTVSDDGVGPGGSSRDAADGLGDAAGRHPGQGLANIRARAEKLGGTSSFTSRPAGGSVLRWTVPLHWFY